MIGILAYSLLLSCFVMSRLYAAAAGSRYPDRYNNYGGYQQSPSLSRDLYFTKDSSKRTTGLLSEPQSSSRSVRPIASRKRVPKLDGPVVTINFHYGDGESKTVIVHKDYLCSYSKYFRAALNTPAFAETETQEIDLEELASEPFDSFLQWLYHQSIPSPETADVQYMRDLIRLWIFADKYIVPMLQNEAMSRLASFLDAMMIYGGNGFNLGTLASQPPMNSWLEYAYKNTTDGSRLRRILSDSLAVRFRGIDVHSLPLELVRDIFESVQLLPDDGGPFQRDYYVSEDID